MSSEKDEKTLEDIKHFGVDPRSFKGKEVRGYILDRYIGHGTIGIVYHATKKDISDEVACKIIPQDTLKLNWEIELRKIVRLEGITQVVHYRSHSSELLPGKKGSKQYVCIFYQFVNGTDLEKYAKKNPNLITLSFVQDVVTQILHVFKALKEIRIIHGDLHEGNIMITEPDKRLIGEPRRIMVTDFGIGGSNNRIAPKDDYVQLALIASNLIRKCVDPSRLEGEDRSFYTMFLSGFLGKQLCEKDVTMGNFVRNPEKLLENLQTMRESSRFKGVQTTLRRPFDYLSCESLGDSFELLQKLYSRNFVGYQDLTERMNTVLTGPRGCGKTTIFRNLSFKTQLLGKQTPLVASCQYLGIYYHCSDLYFAFPYRLPAIKEKTQRLITDYFNLALLYEILSMLLIAQEKDREIPVQAVEEIQGFLKSWITNYQNPPSGTSVLRHILSLVANEKQNLRDWIDQNGVKMLPKTLLTPQDFLKRFCELLQSSIPWLRGTSFYIFLDDYSTPKISEKVQSVLNSFIFERYSQLFFKVSTNSFFTFYPYDATGKLLDETREYDVIDLGDYFLHASPDIKEQFLLEIVNNRLENAEEFDWKSRNISEILLQRPYTYNQLALKIRSAESYLYFGWNTVIDLCSGDIAHTLRLIRDMFNLAGAQSDRTTISEGIQDKAIKEAGNDFLNRIEAAPRSGRQLRKIVQAFGNVSNYYLRTRNSKNEKAQPPFQAFRIEVRETPFLENDEGQTKLRMALSKNKTAERYYQDLIRYSVFIRDVRGKSQRGAVVPRLYLRRLLLPTFLLTPNSRDNMGLEVSQFMTLLTNPKRFETSMKQKTPRRPIPSGGKQAKLDERTQE